MDILEGLATGLAVAFTPQNLLAAFLGCLAGTAIGVLPGLGPVAGAALLLPLTFNFDPVAGVIMLAGIWYGAQYGGSTTSVLLNIPGEASSVVTAIDGYQMTKKGRAGAALSIMAMGSFVAGTLSIIMVTLLAGVLARVGIYFGPVEQFALCLGGLFLLTRISGGSWMSSLLPAAIGLSAGTVGMEAVTGTDRFTFGITSLSLGIQLVPVAVGLFGISEIMKLASDPSSAPTVRHIRMRQLVPTKTELRRAVPAWLRGTAIGFFFGLVPGPSATLSSFASYRAEDRKSVV
jgi:putative tricarboxylic transport membrane protein